MKFSIGILTFSFGECGHKGGGANNLKRTSSAWRLGAKKIGVTRNWVRQWSGLYKLINLNDDGNVFIVLQLILEFLVVRFHNNLKDAMWTEANVCCMSSSPSMSYASSYRWLRARLWSQHEYRVPSPPIIVSRTNNARLHRSNRESLLASQVWLGIEKLHDGSKGAGLMLQWRQQRQYLESGPLAPESRLRSSPGIKLAT